MQIILNHCLRAVMVTALVSLFCLAAPARAAEEAAQSFGIVSVPSGLSHKEVKATIVETLLARSWTIQDKSDDKIVGQYIQRENEATLTLKYDTKQIEVFCSGHSRRGGPPTRWIDYIKKDLNVYLNRAAINK